MTLGIRSKLLFVSAGILLVSTLVADSYLGATLQDSLVRRIRADLTTRLRLIEKEASDSSAGLDDRPRWDHLADELGRRADARVTFVRADGLVLGDSEVSLTGLAGVDNHRTRPEIEAALAGRVGSSTRWSRTVQRKMMYVAAPFRRDGRIAGAARLAEPLTDVDQAMRELRRRVLLGSALALGLALGMTLLAAQWISRPVRRLRAAALRMAAGDLAARTGERGRDELAQLGRALDQLAASLQAALQEARAERDRMSRVLDGMREGVLLVDREGRIGLANPALRRMLLLGRDVVGWTPLEVVRSTDLTTLLDRASASTEPVAGEIELGEVQPRRLLVHAARLTDERGGLLAVFVDVTDLRRLESVRRDFVANASHELRTPVAAVRSAAETLRIALESDPAAAGTFLDIIERHARRLQDVIEDLLDLSRIESREHHLEVGPVDVRVTAEHIASLFRATAADKHMSVVVAAAPDLPPVRADRRALEHVLSNLVENAVKYASENTLIVIGAAPTAAGLRIWVRDEGPGIEARHLPRLFERFYRVDEGRARDVGGTGLGLAIVRRLVEAMEGTVSVDSSLGVGTTFSFTLPSA